MLQSTDLIIPDWPAPPRVKSFFTTRAGGVSTGAYRSLNFGAHVGDEPANVAENRSRLQTLLPAQPLWLNQVHGSNVIHVDGASLSLDRPAAADASVTAQPSVPCNWIVGHTVWQ